MAGMKHFVLVHHGYLPSTPSVQAAWDDWLARRAANVADVGAWFGPGRLVTTERTFELPLDANPASGYSIVRATHLDAAEQLIEGCPIADSISLYEALHVRPSTIPITTVNQQKATDR